MKRIYLAIVLVVALAAFAAPAQAGSSDWKAVAKWEMNEGPRQSVLHDASGNKVTGVIGDKIVRKGKYFHFKKYAFHAPLDLEKTIRVKNNALNPGADNFAISWRFRTNAHGAARNFAQKGQGSPAGGMFKFRLSRHVTDGRVWTRLDCFWRGSNGDSLTTSPVGKDMSNGKWHTARCARIGDKTLMYLDGNLVDTNDSPGVISNDWALSIGGNIASCNTVGEDGRHCNYYAGDLGWMRVWKQ